MTCIVAIKSNGRVVMAADSQASNNGIVFISSTPKIVRRDGFLFASDGALWLGDFFRYVKLPEWPVVGANGMQATLAEWCSTLLGPLLRAAAAERNEWRDVNGAKEYGGQTLVAHGGELVLIDSGGSVIVPADGWWAIGSGGAEARGAIHYATNTVADIADIIAEGAVQVAIALDNGCAGPIQTEWTERDEGKAVVHHVLDEVSQARILSRMSSMCCEAPVLPLFVGTLQNGTKHSHYLKCSACGAPCDVAAKGS